MKTRMVRQYKRTNPLFHYGLITLLHLLRVWSETKECAQMTQITPEGLLTYCTVLQTVDMVASKFIQIKKLIYTLQ
jgi:hypothetical protein